MGNLPLRPGGESYAPTRLVVDSADRLVNTTRILAGQHAESERPVHSAGIVAEGRFTASGKLTPWCRTECLTVGTSTAVVRFSNFRKRDLAGRRPGRHNRVWSHGPDVRGMACRLVADEREAGGQNGHELDLVAMTAPRFLVRREEDFHHLARGRGPKLLRLLLMAVCRRSTFTAIGTTFWLTRIRWAPWRGLADHRYFGVHTFWLESAGQRRAARYHWRPVPGLQRRWFTRLDTMLAQQLAGGGTVSFDLVIDVFDDPVPYRKTNDPLRRYPGPLRELWPMRHTKRWAGTTRVIAGRLTLTTYGGPHHRAAEQWVFNPVPAIAGFEPSDDEILLARGGAYLASHVRRRSDADQTLQAQL